MKPPIWERQGRPKPPRLTDQGVAYAWDSGRIVVVRDCPKWVVAGDHDEGCSYPTFPKAIAAATSIAYADREARR